MFADWVGAGLSVVGLSAGGMGSTCTKGCVAGLPVNVAQMAGSVGGGGGGGATLWSGARADAALFLEVSTVTAPAAAPILNASLRLIPPFRGFDFLGRFLVDYPIRSFFSSVDQKNGCPESVHVYIPALNASQNKKARIS